MLDKDELVRYNRQLRIPKIGEAGQERLKTSRVVIAGVGGLGCVSATYLAAAGVGHITVVDFDVVELSNLNRQVLYWEEDIGANKVVIAQKKLSKLNPNVEITPVCAEITEENASNIISEAQVVVDGLDKREARLAVNAACLSQKIPYVYGGVSRLRGMVTTIIPGETPCLACFDPEGERGLGVLGITPALIANLQALESIKLLLGVKPALAGKLLMFNGDDLKFRIYDMEKNAACPVCSQRSLN